MSVDNYILYLLIATGYIASPGPAVFIAINNGATIGLRKTALTLLGNTIGLGCIALISSIGIGALIISSAILTNLIKIVGAVWLVYIGSKMMLSDTKLVRNSDFSNYNKQEVGSFSRFKDGLILALTNPKPIIFFISIYPQFIIANGNEQPQFFILGITFMILSFTLLNIYALLSKLTIGKVLNPKRMRFFNIIFGLTFFLLALFLLYPIILGAHKTIF